jgi:ligand-binding sensor domain-containing protein
MQGARPLQVLMLLGIYACSSPDQPAGSNERAEASAPRPVATADSALSRQAGEQISTYIRCIFQDRDGSLWFGTTSDGACRYDGRSLAYFNAQNGFGSDWVNAIGQDEKGDLWFATRDGAVRYDGTQFIRFTTKDGLPSDRIWSMLPTRDGTWWFGTYEGAVHFDGNNFTTLPIPAADLSDHPYYEDPKRINAIAQDKAGDIWFASNGGGVFRYNGSTLTNFSEKDGLCNNFVQAMLVDHNDKLWFGTRFSGLCMYDGSGFTAVREKELKNENITVLFEDAAGTLWFNAHGLCSYKDTAFTRFDGTNAPKMRAVMSAFEDQQGQLWLGTGTGLYRHEAGRFANITKEMIQGVAAR